MTTVIYQYKCVSNMEMALRNNYIEIFSAKLFTCILLNLLVKKFTNKLKHTVMLFSQFFSSCFSLCCVVAGSYEPPLTNVFTMQWFLTMFATCLPHHTVLKIWDSVFFEGSEVLLRVALAIWAKLAE